MKLEDKLREDGWYQDAERLAAMKRQLELSGASAAGNEAAAEAVDKCEDALNKQYEAAVKLVDSENDLDFSREIVIEHVLEISEKIKKHNPEAARKMFEVIGIEQTRKIFRQYMDIDFDEWIDDTG